MPHLLHRPLPRLQILYRHPLLRLLLRQNRDVSELSHMRQFPQKQPADNQRPNLRDPLQAEFRFQMKAASKTDPTVEIVRNKIKVIVRADSVAVEMAVDATVVDGTTGVKSARSKVTVTTVTTVVTAMIEAIATTVAIVTIAVIATTTLPMAEDFKVATISKIKIISKAAVRVIAAVTKINKPCSKVVRAATTASADNKMFVAAKE